MDDHVPETALMEAILINLLLHSVYANTILQKYVKWDRWGQAESKITSKGLVTLLLSTSILMVSLSLQYTCCVILFILLP